MRKRSQESAQVLDVIANAINGVENLQMDEEAWNIPAADTKGHSAKVISRVPPAVARAIEQLVQSKQYPFPTSDDFIRFAIVLALRVVNRIAPGVVTTISACEAIIRVMRDYENEQAIRTAVELACSSCEQMLLDGDKTTLASHIAYIDHAINKVSDSSQWKRRFQEEWRSVSKRYREFVAE